MKFNDLLAFAKAGYSPADVKELLSISTETEENVSRETIIEESHEVAIESQNVETVVDTVNEPVTSEPDYKALYEESQKKLQTAQQHNIKTDMRGQQESKTDSELFNELARSFM